MKTPPRHHPVISKLENCVSLGVVLVVEDEAGLWELEPDGGGGRVDWRAGCPILNSRRLQSKVVPFCGDCKHMCSVGENDTIFISGQDTPKQLPSSPGTEGS